MLTDYLASKNNKICRWINKTFRGCEIHPICKIPKSIRVGHGSRGIVIENVKIGKNVLIMHNVTIANNFLAKDKKDQGFPEIGNKVVIGAGSIILGTIKVGDNSVIGAGSFINKDIPPNSIVYNKREIIIRKGDNSQEQSL